MKKILIFGNSGAGKSTLAKQLCQQHGYQHLDLDTLAWLPEMPPVRKALSDSMAEIEVFMGSTENWVIEGCYTDLLELVAEYADQIIFMDLPVKDCIANAENRPWEPHKYESKAVQDANLPMLKEWISQYESRDDLFSRRSHQALFDRFPGNKTSYSSNVIVD
ncbi:AAA family ATPase [Oceanospirillum sediminis]|uniref:AAA family ATPase n=1 Tax=Oceanospirillum sediminis TaxID=2760088 RepID=A0A839IKW3_9GAMM|nr:AAA family ATPase [Oceanospirillum sediminis]MBB1485182.1 AAA family ATPase [Oceanospirillum sediminis]